jgi:hypothetical protein
MTTEADNRPLGDEASAKANDRIESLDDSESVVSGKELSDKRPWLVGRRIWRRPDGTWSGEDQRPARSSTSVDRAYRGAHQGQSGLFEYG